MQLSASAGTQTSNIMKVEDCLLLQDRDNRRLDALIPIQLAPPLDAASSSIASISCSTFNQLCPIEYQIEVKLGTSLSFGQLRLVSLLTYSYAG